MGKAAKKKAQKPQEAHPAAEAAKRTRPRKRKEKPVSLLKDPNSKTVLYIGIAGLLILVGLLYWFG